MASGAFETSGRWLDDHKVTISLLVSGIGLSVIKDLGEVVTDSTSGWFAKALGVAGIAVTLVTAFYGSVEQSKLSKKNRDLEEQLEATNELVNNFGSDYFDIWDNRLRVLAEVLIFDARDRISVYRHTGESFKMVGRFASLPDLNRPGRGVYPTGQGVIGTAWTSGEGKCVVQDFPDPSHDLEAYCTRNRTEWSIPSSVTRRLSMKARSIAAYALDGHNTTVRDAIIVFESTDAGRFSVEVLEQHVYGTTGKDIAHLLKILDDREPSLDFASARGF